MLIMSAENAIKKLLAAKCSNMKQTQSNANFSVFALTALCVWIRLTCTVPLVPASSLNSIPFDPTNTRFSSFIDDFTNCVIYDTFASDSFWMGTKVCLPGALSTGFPVGPTWARRTLTVTFGAFLYCSLPVLVEDVAQGLLATVATDPALKGENASLAVAGTAATSSPNTSKLVMSAHPSKLNLPFGFGNSTLCPNSSFMYVVAVENCQNRNTCSVTVKCPSRLASRVESNLHTDTEYLRQSEVPEDGLWLTIVSVTFLCPLPGRKT